MVQPEFQRLSKDSTSSRSLRPSRLALQHLARVAEQPNHPSQLFIVSSACKAACLASLADSWYWNCWQESCRLPITTPSAAAPGAAPFTAPSFQVRASTPSMCSASSRTSCNAVFRPWDQDAIIIAIESLQCTKCTTLCQNVQQILDAGRAAARAGSLTQTSVAQPGCTCWAGPIQQLQEVCRYGGVQMRSPVPLSSLAQRLSVDACAGARAMTAEQ